MAISFIIATNSECNAQPKPPTSDELATRMTDEMKARLNLSDKQQKKIYALKLKEAEMIIAGMPKSKNSERADKDSKSVTETPTATNSQGRMGGGVRSGGGMPGGGMPGGGMSGGGMPGGGMRPGSDGINMGVESTAKSSEVKYSDELLEKLRQKNELKLKKILSPSQYKEWQKMHIEQMRREFEDLSQR